MTEKSHHLAAIWIQVVLFALLYLLKLETVAVIVMYLMSFHAFNWLQLRAVQWLTLAYKHNNFCKSAYYWKPLFSHCENKQKKCLAVYTKCIIEKINETSHLMFEHMSVCGKQSPVQVSIIMVCNCRLRFTSVWKRIDWGWERGQRTGECRCRCVIV